MESVSMIARFTRKDWDAVRLAQTRRLLSEKWTARRSARLVLILLAAWGVGFLAARIGAGVPFYAILLGGLTGVVASRLNLQRILKLWAPQEGGLFLNDHHFEFSDQGLRATQAGLSSLTEWSAVRAVSASSEHVFLWLDNVSCHTVPLRFLPQGISHDELKRRIEHWSGRAFGVETSAQPAPTPSTTMEWLSAIARLLLLRSARVPATARTQVIILLALVALATWVGIDWLRTQPDPQFYPYNVTAISWYALMALGAAAFIRPLTIPPVAFGRMLIILIAVAPLIIVAFYLIDTFVPPPWQTLVTVLVLSAYLIAYWIRSMRAMTGIAQFRAVCVTCLLAIAVTSATNALYVDASVWYLDEDEAESDGYDSSDSESVVFYQAQRIDEAVARMSPSDRAAPSAFFLGFAGYADQRVFAEEIKLAAKNVGVKYGSTDRSLLLVNDRRSLEDWPLASPTALRYALRAVAAKMNVDKDVLFLSISSHGSRDGTVSVSNGILTLNDLSASDLAEALKESGIKWRVIVVSACYSGTFIEPLRAPGTAVITAAAADRTSFGCSDDRDLTYFGEAFYRDALPEAGSLREAFDRTRKAITERETQEGEKPSHPQAEFGAGIAEKVAELSP
jgi:hypothetical protein